MIFPYIFSRRISNKQLVADKLPAPDNRFIIFMTGDSGYTKFAKNVCTLLQSNNYNVICLNALYFWGGKTLTEAVYSFTEVVKNIEKEKKVDHITVISYSFGADITPFIINNISDDLRSRISEVLLLAPSERTDLKINLTSLIFPEFVGKLDVIKEINTINIPVKVILNTKDKISELKLNKSISVKKLQGNHHFDYKFDDLVKTIITLIG
jgi:type IV secretory pathway VirJ component